MKRSTFWKKDTFKWLEQAETVLIKVNQLQ